jgi:hypothetical protein
MKIYRDGKEFELTELELDQAYREARTQYLCEEIYEYLREEYDEDLLKEVEKDLSEIADDMLCLLANDDTHWECEQDAKRQAIKQYLKEKGLQ